VLPDPGEQRLLQVGLVEHARLRKAVHAGPPVAAELGHHAVPGIQQAQPAAEGFLARSRPGSGDGAITRGRRRSGPRAGGAVRFTLGG